MFTIRSGLIRPLNARYMHAREVARYETQGPKFQSDQEAADFLEQDLSDMDFAQFRPARFSFSESDRQVSVPLPQNLVDAAKAQASERGITYERYISQLIERDLIHQKTEG